jgi:hypothetical protein
VISPYAKPGYISHEENSHVSLVKFCETSFDLPTLNPRDEASNGMSDGFDFKQRLLPVRQRISPHTRKPLLPIISGFGQLFIEPVADPNSNR